MRDKKITGKKRLEDIVKAITKIEEFAKGENVESYLDNEVLISAMLYQFAIIGEAINQVDKEILKKYPFPWSKVRKFRNFILHEYPAVDSITVWEAVNKDIPALKEITEKVLVNEFQ